MQKEDSREQTVDTWCGFWIWCLRLLHPLRQFVTRNCGGISAKLCSIALAPLAADWPEALIVAAWPGRMPRKAGKPEKWRSLRSFRIRSVRHPQPAGQRKRSAGKRIPATLVGWAKINLLQGAVRSHGCLAGL